MFIKTWKNYVKISIKKLDNHAEAIKAAKAYITKKLEVEIQNLRDYVDTEVGRIDHSVKQLQNQVIQFDERLYVRSKRYFQCGHNCISDQVKTNIR